MRKSQSLQHISEQYPSGFWLKQKTPHTSNEMFVIDPFIHLFYKQQSVAAKHYDNKHPQEDQEPVKHIILSIKVAVFKVIWQILVRHVKYSQRYSCWSNIHNSGLQYQEKIAIAIFVLFPCILSMEQYHSIVKVKPFIIGGLPIVWNKIILTAKIKELHYFWVEIGGSEH